MNRRTLILSALLVLWAMPVLAQVGPVHIVRHGETVYGIVTRIYGCSASAVEQVARDNRLVNYRIFPGQALRINCVSTTSPTGVAGDFGLVVNPPQASAVTIIVQLDSSTSAPSTPGPTPTPTPKAEGLSLVDMQALLALRGFSPNMPVWCDLPSVLNDPKRPQLTSRLLDAIPTQICPPGLVAIVAKNRDTHVALFGEPPPER